MNILALDLGTKTGYAYNFGDEVVAGTWGLALKREVTEWGKTRRTRRNDPRIKRLCDNITGLGPFDAVVFEDVQFTSTTFQAHLWAGLRSSIWLCALTDVCECVPVGTLKLFATGNGAATKEAMAKALTREPLFHQLTLDDNGVDAAWLWLWARKNLQRLVP